MAGRVVLPFPTSAPSCAAWSDDDELAVGCEDHFVVLSPRLEDATGVSAERHIAYVTANAFTEDEVPLLNNLTSQTFSIGEEQSFRFVQALGWSAPGLARHQHCILGVLSSSHVLALWECRNGNWDRKVIINHALIQYYNEQIQPPAESDDQSMLDYAEKKQVCQRVTAFAWHPKNPRDRMANPCRQRLTVATEGGDILFLSVQSPYDVLNPHRKQWHVEVVAKFNIPVPISMRRPQPLRNPGADYMAWQHWHEEGDVDSATLAFINHGQLYTLRMHCQISPESTTAAVPFCDEPARLFAPNADFRGPLRFCPQTGHLLAFGDDSVYHIDVSTPEIRATHHLDGRWDDPTGIVITRLGGLSRANIASLLSSTSAPTAILSLPSLESLTGENTAWQHAIKECRSSYGTVNGLGAHVYERLWSLEASPYEDYVATVATIHPSQSLAYIIRAEAQTFLDITCDIKSTQGWLDHLVALPSNGSLPSEAILFRAKRHLELLADNEAPSITQPRLAQAIKSCAPAAGTPLETPDATASAEITTLRVRLLLFTSAEVLELKADVLTAIACGKRILAERNAQRAVRHIVNVTTSLANTVAQRSKTGDFIIQLHQCLCRRLVAAGDAADEVYLPMESCTICQAPVPFASTRWARCSNGHRFSRCALTFLSIQKPGITKVCGICRMSYMDGLAILDLDMAWNDQVVGTSVEPPLSDAPRVEPEPLKDTQRCFARILLAACDRCVYCGGKFRP